MNLNRHTTDSQNDSDEWTLVSPQPSPSSSPERQNFLLNQSRSTQTSQSGSDSSLEDVIDDGLTEIELNYNFRDQRRQILETNLTNASAYEACEETGGSSSTELLPGFHPVDTTTDEELSESSSRRSSLTQSQLNEYVDFGKKLEDSDTITVTSQINNLDTSVVACDESDIVMNSEQGQQSTPNSSTVQQQRQSESSLDEESACPRSVQQSGDVIRNDNQQARNGFNGRLFLITWFLSVLLMVTLYREKIFPHRDYIQSRNRRYHEETQRNFKLANNIPPSQLVELRLLDHELSQCVQRQSPSSFKYYMSEEPLYSSKRDVSETIKAHRGLFCYGQEAKWRNRFERLKSEYNLDLRRLVEDAKKHVTTEILGTIDPNLEFKLILNQLEYLDFLESRRNKKQSEETIKYLKAENLQLLRRLNQPNETGYQKIVVELELKNSKLQRENEALKAKFIEKAGPVYIKQSMELERLESENVILKQFLQQVGKDVSKSLKQFNLHTIDTSTILDDHESLNAQIMLTKGYMRRLSEKISTVLIENDGLKEELKEVYLSLSSATNNLPATHDGGMINNNAVGARDKNDSNALMVDSCMRSLYELKERSIHLEDENARLKRDCYKNSGIEKSSGRNLNRTNESNEQFGIEEQTSWKRIGSLGTAVDKRIKDMLAVRNDDTFLDELMVFLTKFNNHVESHELAKVRHLRGESQGDSEISVGPGNSQQNQQLGDKIIPNYIREAIRSGGTNEMQRDLQINGDLFPSQSSDSTNINKLKLPPPMKTNPFERRLNVSYLDYNTVPIPSDASENNLYREEEPRDMEDRLQKRLRAQNDSDEQASPCRQDPKPSDSFVSSEVSKDPPSIMPDNLARDTWFFKRAKQRRQLRHNDFKVESKSNDWAMKRAKLREKLRKASSYIEYHYLPKDYTFGADGKYSHSQRFIKNHRRDDSDKRHGKQRRKQENYNKYFRDEL